MKHLYTLVLLLILSGTTLFAQEPLTDKIVIEFMKPGDPDAQARNYNLVEWPDEAKAAAYKAAEIWASYLEITVPIRVKFGWCDNIEDAIAYGGTTFSYQYTDGLYYPLSLLNQLLGYDKNTSAYDIICVFKSNIKNKWYFGLDGKVGLTPDPEDPLHNYFQEDFITVALHEICHGLGFSSSMNIINGKGQWGGNIGTPRIYDTFLSDGSNNELISFYPNNSTILANALTSEAVYWNGSNGKKANNNIPVKLHANKTWSTSSISHLDEIYARTENNYMAYGMGGITNPDGLGITYYHGRPPVILGMLQDMGWSLKSGATTNENIYVESPIKVYTTGYEIIIEGTGSNDKVLVCDFSGKIRYTGYGSGRVNLPSGLYVVRVADQTYKIRL